MTKDQKHQIYVRRLDGISYSNISKSLDVPEDAVKKYCKNHHLKGPQEIVKLNATLIEDSNNFCKYCLGTIKKNSRGRTKKFCSEECRRKWWKGHPESNNPKEAALYHYTCPNCNKEFTAYGNSKRTYCSHSCYIEHRFGKTERDEIL